MKLSWVKRIGMFCLLAGLIHPVPGQAPPVIPTGNNKITSLPQEAQAPISGLIGADQAGYHARQDGQGYRLKNDGQRLEAVFTASGMHVHAGEHTWGLSLDRYGYGGNLQPVTAAQPSIRDNRVEYARGTINEWYVNGPFGLEQGFTLTAPPEQGKEGPLTLALDMQGDLQATLNENGEGLTLSDQEGKEVLHYSGLAAYNVDGKQLDAWFEIQQKTVLVLVDDKEARYPLTINPWVQKAKLTALDKAAGDYFGVSVAISGDVVVIGAFGDDYNTGAAYVFVKPGGGWKNKVQNAKLVASDRAELDCFGVSVAISSNVVVVGAFYADVGEKTDAGAAYVFVEPGTGWSGNITQSAKLTASDKASGDWLGYSVGISGDVVVAGAVYADVAGISNAGAAYVFVKPVVGWKNMTQTAKLTAADRQTGAQFGASVALNGDMVVVGAKFADTGGIVDAGAVDVFVKPGGGWGNMTQTARLTASDKQRNDNFGHSVAVSGDVVIIGSPCSNLEGKDDAGAAYVFIRPESGWVDNTQIAKLTASDKAVDDFFGYSVAITANKVVVGAYGNNGYTGTAFVFVKPGGGWRNMTQTVRLTTSDKALGDKFGYSVAISGKGIVAGSHWADPESKPNAGAVYVFNNPSVSTTIITADTPDPSLTGESVNVSVTVSGAGVTPTGTVQITGADVNCNIISLSGGSGSCHIQFNSAGDKTIKATYTGNAIYATSTDTEPHKVNTATNGFNSTFNQNATGWEKHVGVWQIESSNYYTTTGVANKFATISHINNYPTLTYEVRMRRTGCADCSNFIMIRGVPLPLGTDGRWSRNYSFGYQNTGKFSVVKFLNNNIIGIKNWTSHPIINKTGWNILKVTAKGSALKFYINGTLVWSGVDSSFATGRVGIGMIGGATKSGEKLWLDWAKLTTVVADVMD